MPRTKHSDFSGFDQLQSAAVFRYPYLWSWQANAGETEGRKSRPVVVAIRLTDPGGHDQVVLFPITSQEPDKQRFAIELPLQEKRSAGLQSDKRLWIILDEYNTDRVGASFYLRPQKPLGKFSKTFFLPVLREFIARRRAAKGIDRSL